jgi:hypothetical protein
VFLPKTNYFSDPPRAYPPTRTHHGPTRPPLGMYSPSLHSVMLGWRLRKNNPVAPNRRPTASASPRGVPFPNAKAIPGGIPHSAPPARPNPPQLRAKSTPPARSEEQLWPGRAWGGARIATGSGDEQGAGGGRGRYWADASGRSPVVGAGRVEQGIRVRCAARRSAAA